MDRIFVAYGTAEHRTTVLEFATEQAAASGYELFVYHIQESDEDTGQQIREEIKAVIQRTAQDIPFEIKINTREESSDLTNVSKQKRLTDAIVESDQTYEYVVMGDVERDSIAGLTHASMTEAVLKTHAIPVMLVPV